MAQSDWTEIAVFIHGITPDERPDQGGSNPNRYFNQMFSNIQGELKKFPGKPPLDPEPIRVNWNWKAPEAPTVFADQDLAGVEQQLRKSASGIESGIRSVNPPHYFLWKLLYKRLRDILTFGVADAFYYVSKDGEVTVRKHIFQYLSDEIEARLARQGPDGAPPNISLNVFGHSAGSLIAHDFLYHLFNHEKRYSADADGEDIQFPPVHRLRAIAVDRAVRLRVRHLYTFGSPLSPWTIRANSLMNIVKDNKKQELVRLGLGKGQELPNPRWVNFWTITDVASYPLAYLYDNPEVVQDRYVNVGLWFPATHTAYWGSTAVARAIAETF